MIAAAATAAADDAAAWMADVPAGWDVARLKYIAKLGTGHTPSRKVPEYWAECTIPWVTLADVWQLRDGRVTTITETAEQISELGLANSAAVLHPAGTVILSRTASVGFSAILGVDAATSQDFMTWTCGPRLKPKYLLYVLRAMKQEFRRLVMGSTHQTIYMPDIERLTVPLPSVEEQERIIAFLDGEVSHLDALVERKLRLRGLLSERRRGVINKTLSGTLNGRDARWRLRYGLRSLEQGWSPQCENREATETEWGVLKVGCVNGAVFDEHENKALPETLEPRRALEIQPGDILISRANTRELLGSAALVDGVRPRLLLSDKLYRLEVDPAVLDPHFLVAWLQSAAARRQIEREATGASASMQNISQRTVRELLLPVPSVPEQRQIMQTLAARTSELDALDVRLQHQLELLEEHRATLIVAAVTGRLAELAHGD